MGTRGLRRWLLALAWFAAGGAWAQEPAVAPRLGASSVLAAGLPLRRDATEPSAGTPWAAASGALLVAVCMGALLVGRRQRWPWLRLTQVGARRAELERLSSQPLTAQASLHAVRWKGEDLLLACTTQQVTVLARKPTPLPEGGTP
jgi:hypothetical protein